MHIYIHCRIIHDSQDMKAAQMLIDRWMDKKDRYIYLFQGVYIYIWCIYIYIYMYVCIYMVCIYICMYVCVCVYIYSVEYY